MAGAARRPAASGARRGEQERAGWDGVAPQEKWRGVVAGSGILEGVWGRGLEYMPCGYVRPRVAQVLWESSRRGVLGTALAFWGRPIRRRLANLPVGPLRRRTARAGGLLGGRHGLLLFPVAV